LKNYPKGAKPMKRLLISTLAIFLLSVGFSFAAGTCTVAGPTTGTLHSVASSGVQIIVTCTADAADGSYPETTISDVGGYLMPSFFVPSAVTVPTNAMDITLEDSSGADILNTEGMNITTSAQAKFPEQPVPFVGDLTLKPINNSENSAIFILTLNFAH